jgi:hypothetical protein
MKYNVALIAINIGYMVIQFVVNIVLTNMTYNDIEEIYNAEDELRAPIAQYVISAVICLLFIYPQAGTLLSFSLPICFSNRFSLQRFLLNFKLK